MLLSLKVDCDRPAKSGQGQRHSLSFGGLALGGGKAAPGFDVDVGCRAAPDSCDFSVKKESARPNPGGPEGSALPGGGDHELAVRIPQQIVRVATWEEPGRRRRRGLCTKLGLVAGEDDGISNWRAHGCERVAERRESLARFGVSNSSPTCKGQSCRRSKDVKVALSEFEAGVLRVDIRWRDDPDIRLAGAVPSDKDSAGRRGVAEAVGVDAHSMTGGFAGHAAAFEEHMQAGGGVVGSGTAAGIFGQAAEGENGEILQRHDIVTESRPPNLHQRRMLPHSWVRVPDAGMDGEQRGTGHGVLQACPRGLAE